MAKRANMKVGRVKSEIAYQTPLELKSKFYLFPFPEASAALLSVDMDAEKIKRGEDGSADLQIKMMTWDKFGNPIDEFTREISQKADERGKLQFHMLTPVSGTVETVELRVEDKNSDAGGFIQKRMGMNVSGETTIIATEPMLIRETGTAFEPASLEGAKASLVHRLTGDLMGSPLTERVVEQGEDLKIVMFFTDSARDFEEIPEGIRTAFAVRPGEGEVFALIPSSEDVSLVEGTNIIRYVTDLPLGYAPMASGRLEIYVGGLEDGGPLMMQLPFTIESYDQATAEEYIQSQVKVQKVRQ
jgi:hypothetical protein